jgi:hypothetical protein
VVTTGGAAVNVTEGWAFTVDEDLWVVAVGVWDGKRDGLREEHPVAIWDETGKLLLNASVPAGEKPFLVNDFRYTRVLPKHLKGGKTYIVGAFYTTPLVDPHVDGGSNNRISPHKQIHWLGRRRLIADKLTFPANKGDSFAGAFGPNLLVEEGVTPSVPQQDPSGRLHEDQSEVEVARAGTPNRLDSLILTRRNCRRRVFLRRLRRTNGRRG